MTDDRLPPSSSAAGDDWLEGLLHADAAATRDAYIADEDFTARVMHAVPGTRAPAVPAWRKPAVALLWGAAFGGLALAMPGTLLDAVREGYRLIATQPVSLAGLAGVAVAMLGLSGAAAAYALRTSD